MNGRERLEEFAGGLNQTERLVVIARYYDELSPAEIAAVLGLEVTTVLLVLKRVTERARRPRGAK